MSNLDRKLGVAALTSVLLFSVAAHAEDEVVEQINMGLELYQEQEYGAAITELEFAMEDIRKQMSGLIAETFPPAPGGWTAGEVESSSGGAALMGGGGGATLERTYTEDDGDGKLEAQLLVDNPMVQAMAGMLTNPALIAAQPNTERERMGRETVIVKWEPEKSRAEVSLMLDGRILMQIKGSGLESRDVAFDLMKEWDIDAVREQTAR